MQDDSTRQQLGQDLLRRHASVQLIFPRTDFSIDLARFAEQQEGPATADQLLTLENVRDLLVGTAFRNDDDLGRRFGGALMTGLWAHRRTCTLRAPRELLPPASAL